MPPCILVDILRRQMRSGWDTLRAALDGLTQEEFWWKPSENARTLIHYDIYHGARIQTLQKEHLRSSTVSDRAPRQAVLWKF